VKRFPKIRNAISFHKTLRSKVSLLSRLWTQQRRAAEPSQQASVLLLRTWPWLWHYRAVSTIETSSNFFEDRYYELKSFKRTLLQVSDTLKRSQLETSNPCIPPHPGYPLSVSSPNENSTLNLAKPGTPDCTPYIPSPPELVSEKGETTQTIEIELKCDWSEPRRIQD